MVNIHGYHNVLQHTRHNIAQTFMSSSSPQPLDVRDLGRLAYLDACAVQQQTHQHVLDGGRPTLLLVEHDPVITVSRRKSAAGNLLAEPQALARLGIDVQPTDRGGDITYHGPGQLVAYPILRLNDLRLNVGRYMRLLEQIVIDTLTQWDIHAHRDHCATGVWIDNDKICAMGIRVRRNVTLHGLALNVDPDLSHFETIIPCGLHGRGVTSLKKLLGPKCPTMSDVKAALTATIQRHVNELLTVA